MTQQDFNKTSAELINTLANLRLTIDKLNDFVTDKGEFAYTKEMIAAGADEDRLRAISEEMRWKSAAHTSFRCAIQDLISVEDEIRRAYIHLHGG